MYMISLEIGNLMLAVLKYKHSVNFVKVHHTLYHLVEELLGIFFKFSVIDKMLHISLKGELANFTFILLFCYLFMHHLVYFKEQAFLFFFPAYIIFLCIYIISLDSTNMVLSSDFKTSRIVRNKIFIYHEMLF